MIKLIHNEADLQVDVTGAIGADWFGDGNTRDTVFAQIKDANASNITVNVHSLGGDITEGLAIYDLLKEQSARVTTKIVGATASAGTVIAMAGDSVEITENSKFLIHNAWTMTAGNAEDHKQTAVDLEKWDNNIVAVYRKKTGKPENEIRDLMAQEMWIDADEAQSWGFIDKVIKTTNKVENYAKYSEILNISDMNKEVLTILGVEKETEALTAVQTLINKVEASKATLDKLDEVVAENEILKEQLKVENDAKIKGIVDAAEKEGKIKAEQKEMYLNLLQNDYKNAKGILDSIEPAKTMRSMKAEKKSEPEKKDYHWYMKNDAMELLRIQKEEPEKFNEIVNTK